MMDNNNTVKLSLGVIEPREVKVCRKNFGYSSNVIMFYLF